MPIFATAKGGGQRALPPAGTELARCYAVCDLGTHRDEYQGKENIKRKCRIFFELPNQQHVFDEARGKEPFTISKEYTLSLHQKAGLRKMLEAWRGRPFTEEELEKFDVAKLVGVPAIITIGHEPRQDGDGSFAKLLNVAGLMKNMTNQMPPAIMKPWTYEIAMGRNDTFGALPDWLKEKISECEEWTKPAPSHIVEPAGVSGSSPIDDDIPF